MRRLDELEATCDAVISMWASFSWYADETNADVFAAMAAKAGALSSSTSTIRRFRARQGPIENRGVHEVMRVVGNRLQTRLEYPDGSRDAFEWRLYEPEELASLGAAAGLQLDAVCAGYEALAPRGAAPRVQLVFDAILDA